jgi:predicted DNA-binding transcriptional regulator AlpA
MPNWLRYRDLHNRGVVRSWTQLRRLIKIYGFPPGRMITPNQRAWTDQEVDAWYASRPVEGPEPRGEAKRRRDDRRKREAAAERRRERRRKRTAETAATI